MRLITNQELCVIAGGGEAVQTVVVTGQRPIGSTSSGGLTGGAGLNFAPKGSLGPTPQQQKPAPECSETVSTVVKEQVTTGVEIGLTGVKITKSDGGQTTTITRTCTQK